MTENIIENPSGIVWYIRVIDNYNGLVYLSAAHSQKEWIEFVTKKMQEKFRSSVTIVRGIVRGKEIRVGALVFNRSFLSYVDSDKNLYVAISVSNDDEMAEVFGDYI